MDDQLEDIIYDTLRSYLEDSFFYVKSVWTNKSFTELLDLLKDMLPDGNMFLNYRYEA